MHALYRQVQLPVLRSLLALTILTGCAGETSAPSEAAAASTVPLMNAAADGGTVDLGGCDSLAAPEGSRMLAHLYAKGSQIYFWDGGQWLFIGPDAVLYSDEEGHGQVGVHRIAGVWESQSGSKVVGMVQRRCTADQSAIQWQLLVALGRIGPGIFADVDYIQRVRTVGGLVPTAPGSVRGDRQYVPYTAEYYFYQASR